MFSTLEKSRRASVADAASSCRGAKWPRKLVNCCQVDHEAATNAYIFDQGSALAIRWKIFRCVAIGRICWRILMRAMWHFETGIWNIFFRLVRIQSYIKSLNIIYADNISPLRQIAFSNCLRDCNNYVCLICLIIWDADRNEQYSVEHARELNLSRSYSCTIVANNDVCLFTRMGI